MAEHNASIVVGDASDPDVMARVDLGHAVGFVAGTDNDTTNLSLIAAARRVNPALFVAARQNQPASAPLFTALRVDSLLVPTEVVAHEVYAQLSTPLLWRFLQEMPRRGDEWAARLIERLTRHCGRHLQALWKVMLTHDEAPALRRWLAGGDARLGDLMRSPEDREQPLHAVVLLVQRDSECVLTPDDEFVLAPGDQMLLTGWPAARRALDNTMVVDSTMQYVVFDRHVPSGWIWRRLARQDAALPPPG